MNEELLKALAEMKAALEAKATATGESVTRFEAQISGLEQKIIDLQAKAASLGSGGAPATRYESIGARFATDAKSALASGQNVALRYDILSKDAAGNFLVPTTNIPNPAKKLRHRIVDMIPSAPVINGGVNFVRETGYQNKAKVVAEGGLADPTIVSYDLKQDLLDTVKTYIPIAKATLNNAPALVTTIEGTLQRSVEAKQDDAIIAQLAADVGIQTLVGVGGTDKNLDLARKAKTNAEVVELAADIVLMNPVDAGGFETAKNTQGSYLLPNGLANGLWGMEVVVSNSVPAGTLYVVASAAVGYGKGEDFVVDIATQHSDNWAKNLVLLGGEVMGRLAILKPEGVVKVTLVVW